MAIVTTDDLAALLGREFNDAEDTQAQAALNMAVAVVAAYLPDLSFDSGDDVTVDLQGTWSRDLELPKQNVTAVTSVAVNGDELDADTGWTWNGRTTLRRGIWMNGSAEGFDVTQGADAGPVGHWGGPSATVTVTYSYDATVPPAVSVCVTQIAKRLFLNPQNVNMEMLGTYQVQYGANAGSPTLTPDEMAILRPYKRRAR